MCIPIWIGRYEYVLIPGIEETQHFRLRFRRSSLKVHLKANSKHCLTDIIISSAKVFTVDRPVLYSYSATPLPQ